MYIVFYIAEKGITVFVDINTLLFYPRANACIRMQIHEASIIVVNNFRNLILFTLPLAHNIVYVRIRTVVYNVPVGLLTTSTLSKLLNQNYYGPTHMYSTASELSILTLNMYPQVFHDLTNKSTLTNRIA